MPDSNITKRALAAALKELLEHQPFSKITVSHICEQCGMNRKSFYYHFKDKYDLVDWIFDTEFYKIISDMEEEPGESRWFLMERLCTYFYENRVFYRKMFLVTGQNSFLDHFKESLSPVVRELLETVLTDCEYIDFYINFYTDAFIAAFVRWLVENDDIPPEKFVELLYSCQTVAKKYEAQYEDSYEERYMSGSEKKKE